MQKLTPFVAIVCAAFLLSLAVTRSAHASARPQDIDALEALGPGELARLFAEGGVPQPKALAGRLQGRALFPQDEHAFCRPCGWAIRTLFKSPLILWSGKTFAQDSNGNWEGRNLFFTAPGGHAAYRMRPVIGPSAFSGRTVLQLDYRVGHNPPIIRRVFDELVEIRPGLWLGKAYFRGEKGGAHQELIWFALQHIPAAEEKPR